MWRISPCKIQNWGPHIFHKKLNSFLHVKIGGLWKLILITILFITWFVSGPHLGLIFLEDFSLRFDVSPGGEIPQKTYILFLEDIFRKEIDEFSIVTISPSFFSFFVFLFKASIFIQFIFYCYHELFLSFQCRNYTL